MKKILFIIGSLREQSFNRKLAAEAEKMLEGRASVEYLDYSDVPFINQDIEFPAPEAVRRVREKVAEADALWIFSPEYNYSYPGHLKNLIDWLSRPVVAGDRQTPLAINGKKVALSGAGGAAATAKCRAKLTELLTLPFIRADVMAEPQTGIQLNVEAWTEGRMVLTEEQKAALKAQADAFLEYIMATASPLAASTTMCKNNMKRISLYVASVMFAFIRLNAFAQPSDRAGSDSLPDNYGVCLYAGGEARGVRMDEPFAMHSIMKFPQAVYVAHCMESRKIPLHETVRVRKSELVQDTWSPMLRMFEGEKDFSCAELLGLSLAQSDNNACDILFRRFGDPAQVEAYLHELGFTGIHVRWTEQEMGEAPIRSAANNCTPKDMARLFAWFCRKREENEYLRFVWEAMTACQTGTGRITSVIPEGCVFVHKTGTGFPSADGRQDRNDAGVIIMPDGTCKVLAVFAPQSIREGDVAAIGRKHLGR